MDAISFVAARTPLERALAAIWADVLGLPADRIGIHHNFFELGGHSLLATQLVVHVRDLLQADISLRALFEHPTISGLVELIARDPAEHARVARTAELLLMLSELSDEEAAAMLQKQ
jgi:acyl carrier protein